MQGHLGKNTHARPLKLGDTFGSSIDAASIPSAIFISAARSEVVFGEAALERGEKLEGKPASLFETSPKQWVTGERSELNRPEAAWGGVSRSLLLGGLIAHAVSAAHKSLRTKKARLKSACP